MKLFCFCCTNLLPFYAIFFSISVTKCASLQQADAAGNGSLLLVNNTIQDTIVGGTQANPKEFPCFVQGQGCGGSLVWHDIVLTAAHCRYNWFGDALVGAFEYHAIGYGAERIRVKTTVQHPKYEYRSSTYDFRVAALRRLPNKEHELCTINTNVSNMPKAGSSVVAIGLGTVGEKTYKHPHYLSKTTLQMVDTNTCNKAYGGTVNHKTMICAYGEAERDTCYGDSGGPLFDSHGIQIGITSWGIGCAKQNYPGVYSNVAAGAPWINKMICQLSLRPPLSCTRRLSHGHLKKRKTTTAAQSKDDSDCANTADVFLWDNDPLVRNCTWLDEDRQLEYRSELCGFPYIASKCPQTCKVCSIYDKETGVLDYD